MALPKTGLKSTSTLFGAGGAIAGIVATVEAYFHSTGTKSAVGMIVGGVVTTFSIVAKLFHDHGVNVATIAAAGSDVVKEGLSLEGPAKDVESFITTEWPASKQLLSDVKAHADALEGKVAEIEAKIPDSAAIVAAAKSSIISAFDKAAAENA